VHKSQQEYLRGIDAARCCTLVVQDESDVVEDDRYDAIDPAQHQAQADVRPNATRHRRVARTD